MTWAIQSFYNGYVMENVVDKKADQAIDRLTKSVPSRNKPVFDTLHRTRAKVALLWITTSCIALAAAANPYSIAVKGTLAVLGTIPFMRPIYSTLKSRAQIIKDEFPGKEKIKYSGTLAVSTIVHIGSMYLLSRSLSIRDFIPLSVILSNLTLNGYTYATQLIFEVDLEDKIKREEDYKNEMSFKIDIAKKKVKELRNKIFMFDNFVNHHEDLRALCLEEMKKNPHLYQCVTHAKTKINNFDLGEVLLNLKFTISDLEHFMQTREQLITHNTPILKCFKKYF